MSWTHERARVASLSRAIRNGERKADDPELTEARRNLRALRLEDHVTRVLADAPPLTDEQLSRIGALLRTAVPAPIDRKAVVKTRMAELGDDDGA